MHVLVFENNLMWSARLAQTLGSLGHTATVIGVIPEDLPAAQAAIVNLGSVGASELVGRLNAAGIYTIGHAGHKEKELQALGKAAGCDRLASNSELTYKLEGLLPG